MVLLAGGHAGEIFSAIWSGKNPSLQVRSPFPITPLHTLEILTVTQGDWVLTVIPLSSFSLARFD